MKDLQFFNPNESLAFDEKPAFSVSDKIEQLKDFWKGNQSRMPQLSSIALSFGFRQSSSAAVERSFSGFSNIVTFDGQCLDPETIKQLLFLYMNSGKLNWIHLLL